MDTEAQSTLELSDQDRLLVVFAYLGPLALVSLLAARKEFVRWHAKQGLVLATALAAVYVMARLVYVVLRSLFWAVVVDVYWACVTLTALGALVLTLFCVIRALDGERFKIPVLGDLADRL